MRWLKSREGEKKSSAEEAPAKQRIVFSVGSLWVYRGIMFHGLTKPRPNGLITLFI